MGEDEIGPEAVQLLFADPEWHLVAADPSHTVCGRLVGYGARHQVWAATPEEERCQLCMWRLRFVASGRWDDPGS